MHIASFRDRKSSSGFSAAPRPPLKRGQIVGNDAGDLFLVWSVSVGIVHAHPLYENHVNDGSNIRAKFTIADDGEVFNYDMWLDADTRRHLPVSSVHAFQSDVSGLIDDLGRKLRQIERRDREEIRSAYAA